MTVIIASCWHTVKLVLWLALDLGVFPDGALTNGDDS